MDLSILLSEAKAKLASGDIQGATLYMNLAQHEIDMSIEMLNELKAKIDCSPKNKKENVTPHHVQPMKADKTDVQSMLDANQHNIELLKVRPNQITKMPSRELRSQMGLSEKPVSKMKEDERFKNVINKVRKSYKIVRREGEEGVIHLVQVYLSPPIYMVKHFLSEKESLTINKSFVSEWETLDLSLNVPKAFFTETNNRECELVYKRLAAFVPYGFDERSIVCKAYVTNGEMANVLQLREAMKDMGGYVCVLVLEGSKESDTRLDFINLGFQANCEPGLLIFAQIDKFSEAEIFNSVLLSVNSNENTRATILTLQMAFM